MPRKCCVPQCKSNYLTGESCQAFRFPKDAVEKQKWVVAIPRSELIVSKHTVVCRLHWPESFRTYSYYGKERPVDPPSVFAGIPPSCCGRVENARTTKKALSSSRNVMPDELPQFKSIDLLKFEDIVQQLPTLLSADDVVAYQVSPQSAVIQSKEILNGVPKFLLNISNTLHYESYHKGVSCSISTLASNRCSQLKCWSSLEEALRFLRNFDDGDDNKKKILFQHLSSMGNIRMGCGKPVYSPEMITRCFEYFATSRALYSRLCNDYQLPSVRTLTRITSRYGTLDDGDVLAKIITRLPQKQRRCIILLDEIYVKAALRYHGGSVFGKAVNKPDKLAKTVLCFMVKCLFGGPAFLAKVIPVCELDSEFQYSQCSPIYENIKSQTGGEVSAIIADGNRVNQKFFARFNTEPEKPWLVKDSSTYLLYDYVHLLKSIRNNWLTEKCGELEFEVNGKVMVARWSDLVCLHSLEENSLIKVSRLNKIAVYPKPIERQRVSTCLQIFCDETIAALETHPSIDQESVIGTITFIKIFVNFWKIVNVRQLGKDNRLRDEMCAVIKSPDDSRLDYLLEIASMTKKMETHNSRNRVRALSRDTSKAFSQTCRGLVDMSRCMLSNGHDFVLLGNYTTDFLEKDFSKMRQGLGGAYFISVQQIMEKVRIDHAKLLLRMNVDLPENTGHMCDCCSRAMNEKECEIFDNLELLEDSVTLEAKYALVYIAGYVDRKNETTDDTYVYFNKYGLYLRNINRGGLKIPGDCVVQWATFCYSMFFGVSENCCLAFLMKIFTQISDKYHFNRSSGDAKILANILLNNYSKWKTPYSGKERDLKVIKLK